LLSIDDSGAKEDLMREWSVAVGIVERVQKELERLGGLTADAVYVRLGRLAGIVPDTLRRSFVLATEHTELARTQLVIESVAGRDLVVTALELHS
jgi:Zn finger protein HypA/HybF involved in hydrogenase expression